MNGDDSIPTPKIIAVPSDRLWFDPIMLNTACSIQITDVAISGTGPQVIIPGNVNRWAIMFVAKSPNALPSLGPWPDAASFPLFVSTGALPLYQTNLFTIGPIISNQWWVTSLGAMTIRVVESIRN